MIIQDHKGNYCPPIDLSAETKVPEHATYPLQYVTKLRYQEPQPNPHSVSTSAWQASCCKGVQPHRRSSSYLETRNMSE